MKALGKRVIIFVSAFVVGYVGTGFLRGAKSQSEKADRTGVASDVSNHADSAGSNYDPESRVREVLGQPPPISFPQLKAAQIAIDDWLQKDPVGCLTFLKETGNLGLVSATQIRAGIDLATKGEPSLALGLLARMPSWNGSDRIYEHYFKEFGIRDPKSALLFAPNVPSHLRKALTQNLVMAWAKRDGMKALQEQIVNPNVSDDMLSLGIAEATKLDSSGVRDFLSSLPPSRSLSKDRFRGEYLWALDASEVIPQIKDSATSPYYKNMLNFKLADNFQAKGLENNPYLNDPALRGAVQRALSIASQQIAYTDPKRAFQYASKIDGERLRTGTVVHVIETVAKKDVNLAQKLTGEIEEPATRAIAASRIAEIVAKQNPPKTTPANPQK